MSKRRISVTLGSSVAPDPSSPAAPPKKAADRSPASGTADDLQTVAKAALGRIPKAKRPKMTSRLVQAASDIIEESMEAKRKVDTARYEALAREHGADLSEEGFNEVLRKVGGAVRSDRGRNGSEKS